MFRLITSFELLFFDILFLQRLHASHYDQQFSYFKEPMAESQQ